MKISAHWFIAIIAQNFSDGAGFWRIGGNFKAVIGLKACQNPTMKTQLAASARILSAPARRQNGNHDDGLEELKKRMGKIIDVFFQQDIIVPEQRISSCEINLCELKCLPRF